MLASQDDMILQYRLNSILNKSTVQMKHLIPKTLMEGLENEIFNLNNKYFTSHSAFNLNAIKFQKNKIISKIPLEDEYITSYIAKEILLQFENGNGFNYDKINEIIKEKFYSKVVRILKSQYHNNILKNFTEFDLTSKQGRDFFLSNVDKYLDLPCENSSLPCENFKIDLTSLQALQNQENRNFRLGVQNFGFTDNSGNSKDLNSFRRRIFDASCDIIKEFNVSRDGLFKLSK